METIRSFIAVELEPDVLGHLEVVQEELRDHIAGGGVREGLRWARAGGIHLTLKFLGDVADDAVPDIARSLEIAVAGVSPFDLRLEGLGCFPNFKAPRVLWIGLGGDREGLARLQAQVETAMEALGFGRERRPFSPHLTLARCQDRLSRRQRAQIGERVETAGTPEPRVFRVEGLHLVQSELRPSGASYASLFEARLAGIGDRPIQSGR